MCAISTRPGRSMGRLAAMTGLGALLLAGCTSADKPGAAKPCCDQPKIPAGVPAFTVFADDVTGPSDGQDVKIRAAFNQKTKRDDSFASLRVLYAWVMKRSTFEPTNFVGELYNSEADAKAGSNLAAKIWRARGDQGPKCDVKTKLELPEQVVYAFAYSTGRREQFEEDPNDSCRLAEKKKVTRFDDKFTKKPVFKLDAARGAVEVTYPYLDDGGKDEYAKALSFNTAMTWWAEFTTTMFAKADDLQEMTFTGMWNEEQVLKITVTRQEFNAKLSNVQETVASFAAITFAKLGLRKADDKSARKEQEEHKAKTYKAALSFLPKDRVMVSSKLKS